MKRNDRIPPAIYKLKQDLDSGKLTRRGFIRLACMAGMCAAAAGKMAEMMCPGEVFAAEPSQGAAPSGKVNTEKEIAAEIC